MSRYIKACRKNAGITQEQLAEKMDVTTVTVQNWENGKYKIALNKCMHLAEVLNISVDNLIKEMLIEEDKKRPDRWPRFLFHDDTNDIIDTLHLNLAQQDLFGLLYIYNAKYLKKKVIDFRIQYVFHTMSFHDCVNDLSVFSANARGIFMNIISGK